MRHTNTGIVGRFRLGDLRDITEEEFERAANICQKIRQLVDSRTAYVEDNGIDLDISLPASSWSEGQNNPIHEIYNFVVTPNYDAINRLRLYTQMFSGFQLTTFEHISFRREPVVLYPIPENFDEELEKLSPRPDKFVIRYDVLNRYMPKDIVVSLPPILGELGWNIEGKTVNRDSFTYQERLNCLYESGVIGLLRERASKNGSVTILEIGGGYGGSPILLNR